MGDEKRQFLLTAAWMFMRHGQPARARVVFEALAEADPHDGVVSVALAQLLLDDGEAEKAVELLKRADVPNSLEHAEAVLETRALRLSGREREANARWNRYIESQKGASRQWLA